MASFSRSFDFHGGTLEKNLATIDERIDEFLDDTAEQAAARGEATMKRRAPWTDNTGRARAELWGEAYQPRNGVYSILLGQGVKYGIYLERSNDGRFQIVMPTITALGRAFMRSLEGMLNRLDQRANFALAVVPDEGGRQGSSQAGAGNHARAAYAYARRKGTARHRVGRTSRTRRTR
jgi:hypothetical protein